MALQVGAGSLLSSCLLPLSAPSALQLPLRPSPSGPGKGLGGQPWPHCLGGLCLGPRTPFSAMVAAMAAWLRWHWLSAMPGNSAFYPSLLLDVGVCVLVFLSSFGQLFAFCILSHWQGEGSQRSAPSVGDLGLLLQHLLQPCLTSGGSSPCPALPCLAVLAGTGHRAGSAGSLCPRPRA